MAFAPFPVDPHLTSIAIAYRNLHLIADEVLPRVAVSKQSYRWKEFSLEEAFSVPNTVVGRTSKPNEVEFTSTEKDSSTKDHALDAPVPNADIENQPAGYDLLGRTTERVTDLILLDREVRASRLVFNKNSYKSDHVKTLIDDSQWSHDDSKPIIDISDALDSLLMRPNVAVWSQRVATQLRRNKSIVRAYNGSMGGDGMVPLAFLKELFGLEDILIGMAFINTTKPGPGKKAVLERAWSDHAAFIYRNKLADTNGGLTFGMTAQFGNRVSSSLSDADIGMRGGQRVRVGESLDEIVIAKDVGCFFENVIATT